MKKAILIISAICVAACALTACNSSCGNEYKRLNSKLKEDYSQISITVNNTFTEEQITLTSVYTVKYAQNEITVDYKVERFSEFTLESPVTDVKTTYEGSASIVGGIISGGEEVGLTEDIASLNLNFKKKNFENVTFNKTFFSADVKNTNSFLGVAECTDMHVVAGFDDKFKSITVSYKQGVNEVEYKYVFTN